MKKIAVTLLTIFSLFVISCEIGLGASVDTDAPSLDITNPPVDSIIRDTFAITGTWSDDGNIANVLVKLKKTDGNGEPIDIEGTLHGDIRLGGSGTWSADIIPVAEDGTRLISDGSYQATVTIKDTAGRTTIRNTTFTIDNTPPVIVLTRPSTAADSLSSDTYGQTFNLEGQAADTNNVSLIEVMIYSDAACTNHIHTVPLKNVPNSINMDVAKFVKGDTENDYFKIYGESTTDGGPKQFYCKLVAYDGAQRFPADGSEQTEADLKGNGIDSYYLYKDIATTILQNYKITEVYSILNGTFTPSGAARAVTVDDVMSLLNTRKKTQGKFTLNPKNNPTFAVTGRNPLLLNGSDFTGTANNISDGTKVVLEVSPGLDGILLEESSLKVYAVECDLNGNKTGTLIALDFDKEESGTSYRLITKIDKAKGLAIGKNYLFEVEGWDQSESKNRVEPAGLAYGFHMATSGRAPVLELSNPSSSTSYTNESKQIFTGSVSVEDGVPKVIVTYNSTEYEITNFTTSANGNETKYSFEWESPDFGDSNSTHQFEFKAVMDTDSQPIERTIVHDIEKPVIGDLKISEAIKYDRTKEDASTISGRYLNGIVTASIDITDSYDAIKKATYKIIKNGNEDAAEEITIANPAKFTFPPLNTTELDDDTTLTIKVTAIDRAGNIETHTEDFIVDQTTDIPFVYPKDHASLSLKEDAELSKIAVTASSSFVLKVYDDDGISSSKLTITAQISNKLSSKDAAATNWNTLSSPTITFIDDDITIRVPESGGFYKYKIAVKDIANDKTYEVPEFVINAAMPQATITSITKTPDYIKNTAGKFTITIDGISSQGPYTVFRKIENKDTDFVEVQNNINDFPITDTITLASNNSISEGAKVYYYVMDGTPRKSNEDKFVSLTFDDDAPSLTITSPSTNKTGISALSEPILFGGNSSDAKSGIAKILYRFTKDADADVSTVPYVVIDSSSQPIKSSPFTIDSVQFASGTTPVTGKLEEGTWYFQAYAEDAVGNTSTLDIKEFDINLNAPSLTVTVNGNTETCKLSGGAYYFKGSFIGKVNSSDTDGSGKVEFKIGDSTTPVLTWSDINNSEREFTIDGSNFEESKQQKLTIIATDGFGKTTSEIINVYKDTTNPDLSVTNPGDQTAASVTIRGTVNDSGIGVEKVQWSTSSSGTFADVTAFNHNSPNWSLSVSDLGVEGDKTYCFKAIDALNNTSNVETASFTYDKAAPAIITKIGSDVITLSETRISTSVDNKFKFKIDESNGLAASNAVTLLVKKGETELTLGSDYTIKDGNTAISSLTAIQANKEYSIEINTYTDALYTYEMSATDKAGKSSGLVSRTIRLDTKAPVIDVTTPDFSTYQNSTSINVRGTCEDDSGTLYVWYATGNSAPAIPEGDLTDENIWSAWTKAEGTSSWTAKDIPGVEGTPTNIYFAAVDKNGIATKTTEIIKKEYKVDLTDPVFTETGINEGTKYTNAAYTFSGTASDPGSDIKSIKIAIAGTIKYAWYKDNPTGTTSGFTNNYNNTTKTWSWSYTVPVTSATEDSYSYTLTATDGADKTTNISRTVVYDKTDPVIGTVSVNEWYKTRTISLQPPVTDGLSGIDTVEATIKAGGAGISDSSRDWIDVPLSNGNYKGTVDFDSDGRAKKIYIRATDRAGNVSEEKEVSVNIDTSDPDLEKLKYQVGSTSLKDIGGTVYINATNGITVYGSYSDEDSGVAALEFEGTKKDANGKFLQPVITYSGEVLDSNNVNKDEVNELTYSTYASGNASDIKYWKAEFTNSILETARLSVTGKNIAGGSKTISLFTINKDETPPTFTRPKIEPNTEDRIVYQNPTSKVYYLNNALQKFTISGLAEDGTAVDKVYLKIVNVNAEGNTISTSRVIEDNNATGYFNNIEFKQADGTVWTGGAKVTITVTDIAGNSTADNNSETILNIVFDTHGPNGVHLLDKSSGGGKDLYFRIGDQSRDDYVKKDAIEDIILDANGNGTAIENGTVDGTTTTGVPAWADKDKDVGGKYSGNTYGNAETVKLRGKFEDKVSDDNEAAEGSGVNLIYYKVYKSQPDSSNNYTTNFLANYKTQADGYFSLLKDPETRRVFYTDDSTGVDEGKLGGSFTPENGGTVTVTKGTETKKKYFTDITTNYKTTIANLTAGDNYLVLVAVDNVGNAALEGVEYNGEVYADYRINVDYEAPVIASNAPAIGMFTKAAEALEITGTVADKPDDNHAGINSIWLKYNEADKNTWIKATVNETAGTWTATVPVTTLNAIYGSSTTPVSQLFTATATDKSGKGNTFSCNLTVTIDKTPPTVEISVAEKSNAGTNDDDVAYVNGSIKLKGTASDSNGLKDNEAIKLYYTNDSSEKNSVTDITKWHEYTTTSIDTSNNEWTIDTSTSPFSDNTTYYFTVSAVDKAGNSGYATPLALAVNEDSDRPTVKFYMIFGDDANAISLDKTELDGVISDDDGTPAADKVWYYISYDTKDAEGNTVSGDVLPADNVWIQYNSSNTSVFKYNAATGSFTFKPNDGTEYIWLKIKDNGDTEFVSSKSTTYNFNTPILSDQNGEMVLGNKPATGTTVKAPRLKLKKDTVAPLIDSIAYLAEGMDSTKEAQANNGNGWSSNTGSAVFGGTEANTFKVRIYAYDANGIDWVIFKIPVVDSDSTSATPVADEDDPSKSYYVYPLTSQGVSKQKEINGNTYDLYWSGDIDVTGFVSGQRSCIIDTFDGTKHKTEPISFVIDNTAPTATVTSHNRNDQVGASFMLKGSFEDGDANQTLKYFLSADSTPPVKDDPLWENKEEVRGVTSISWNVYFDGAASDSETTHDKLPKQIVADLIDNVIIAASGENINKAVYETAVTGHAAGSLYRNIETVYFHLLAIDSIGNRKVSTFSLKMDPQGDIPTIKMSYPAYPTKAEDKNYIDGTTVEYAKLNGIIRAQGSAEDDKNIVGIYMQIDPAYVHSDGFDEDNWNTKDCPGKTSTKTSLADFYTVEDMYTSYNTYQTEHGKTGNKTGGPLGIKVGTSSSWNISLNKDGEFNKANDNNFIAIRFFAVDEDGNISDWTDDDLFIISVDSNAPKIGSSEPLYLYQYGFKDSSGTVYYANSASPAAGDSLYSDSGCRNLATGKTYSNSSYTAAIISQQYQDDMWLNGEWWLSGSVEDESGISVLNIREMQSDGTYGDYQDIKSSSEATTFTVAGTSGYIINYRVGSIDDTPGYGRLEYTIYAKDKLDSDGKDTEAVIKLKYDNKSPTLAASDDDDYSIPVDVVNDQGSYKVQSVVTELKDESGFDKVIFYFKRGTTVFDSYMPKSISGISSGLINDSNIYWKTNTVSAVSGNVITVTADSNIHIGGLVKVGGVIYTITDMNTAGTQITLNGNPAAAVNGSQALFAIGHVVDHVGTETEGTKGGKISATEQNPAPYGLGYYGDIPDDDGDLMLEKVSTVSTKTLWYGLINSRNIPDGAVEIHYVAFDKAGNMAHGQVTNAFVKNNGPRLASLRVWTDYNGNNQEDPGESESKFYTAKERKISGNRVERATKVTENFIVSGNDEDWTSTGTNAATAFMRVTDQTKFYPEIVGGNGDLYYSYRIGAGSDQSTWTTTGNNSTTPFSVENRTGYVEYSDESSVYMVEDENHESYVQGTSADSIPVSTTLLNTLGNGLKWFEYTIWDSTAGGTPYTDTLNAKFTVLLNVAYNDTTAPKAVISPFFWNSSSDNSLYQNSKNNGHIELENDLSTTVSTLYGTDPKVSGKITIRGTAYDDIRLSELWVKFDNIAALTGTEANSGYVQAATYATQTATWTPATATMAANGWEFTVTDRYCNKDGHLVDWKLSINTANVTGVAALNKKAYVMAKAERGTGTNGYSSATAGGAEGNVASYNNPEYQMDIVPYITGIKTPNRGKSGLKDNNIRSASGKYSIIKGTTADFITVEGFNLDVSDARIVKQARLTALTTTWTANDITLTPTAKATDFTSFKGRNNLSNSGYLEVLVNNIRALNNINNDNAYGTATKKISNVDAQITATNAAVTDYENAYNREPDYYTTKNVQLTDDRYIRVFDMKDTGIKNGYYPVMMMGQETVNNALVTSDNPVFGYIDLNGINSLEAMNTYQDQCYQPQRMEYDVSQNKISYIEYLIGGLSWDQMAMTRDSSGRYIHGTVYNYAGDAIHLVYNKYAEQHTWQYAPYAQFPNYKITLNDGWGYTTKYNGYEGNTAESTGNNAITLESTSYNNSTLIGRYQGMKLQVKGNSTNENGAIYYMAYFDDNTNNKDLIFRTFNIGSNNTNRSHQLKDGYSNLTEQATANTVTGRITAASNATRFLDLGVTSDGYAVIVYYDSEGNLKLVHSTQAVTGVVTGTTFSTPIAAANNSYIGQYLSMAIDANDHIHIAAFDANKSTLRYIYLDSYSDTTPDEYTVDASTSVGKWTQIKIHNGKPYIAYYNNAEDGQKESIRLAYLTAATVADGYDASGYATGAWEYMTVPSLTPAQGGDAKFQSVCLDFDSAGRPVVGYLGTNLEFGKALDE